MTPEEIEVIGQENAGSLVRLMTFRELDLLDEVERLQKEVERLQKENKKLRQDYEYEIREIQRGGLSWKETTG